MNTKKWLSVLLCVAMIFSVIPFSLSASAEDTPTIIVDPIVTVGETLKVTVEGYKATNDWIALVKKSEYVAQSGRLGYGNYKDNWKNATDNRQLVCSEPGEYALAFIWSTTGTVGGLYPCVEEATVFITAVAPAADPTEVYVSSTGSDENDGLTADTAVASIAKALELASDKDDVTVFVSGEVAYEDIAHANKVTFKGVDDNARLVAPNVPNVGLTASLAGPTVFDIDFSAAVNFFTNGYYFEDNGTVNLAEANTIYAGNTENKNEKLVLNGDYFSFIRTYVNGQTSGNVDLTVNGGVVRLLSTGNGTTPFGDGNLSVTVNAGQLWVYNNIDDGPTECDGALQIILNNGTEATPDSQFGSKYVDWAGAKITFTKGEWTMKSAAVEGSSLELTSEPGTFKVIGDLQAVADANGLKTYSKDGALTVKPGVYTVTYQEPQEIQEEEPGDAPTVYYAVPGGTGDGRSAAKPAGSISTIVANINADGWGEGDVVTVKIDGGQDATQWTSVDEDAQFVIFHNGIYHAATIIYESADPKNHARMGVASYGAQYTNLFPYGNSIFRDIDIIDQRGDYPSSIYSMDYDVTFESTVKFLRAKSGTLASKSGELDIANSTNRSTGPVNQKAGTLTLDMPNYVIRNLFLGGYGDVANQLCANVMGDSTVVVKSTVINKLTLVDSKFSTHYKGNLNLVLYDTTLKSATTSNGFYPTVDGAAQFIVNGKSSLGGLSEIAKIAAAKGLYIINALNEDGNALMTTDTIGKYKVESEKAAVAVDANGNKFFSADGYLTVPAAGTYDVAFVDDDGKYVTVYVAEDGDDSNDGKTADTAVATVAAAIGKLKSDADGTVYVKGTVAYTDEAHIQKVTFKGVDDNARLAAPNVPDVGLSVSLSGPTVFDIDFSAAVNFFTNGYYFEDNGTVNLAEANNIYAGNTAGKNEKVVLNGDYFSTLRTYVSGQTSGDVDLTINGGVLRLLSSGNDGGIRFGNGNLSVTVNAGQLWVYNNIDDGPTECNGALQILLNNGTNTTPDNTFGGSFIDWAGAKITFTKGEWTMKSEAAEGCYLELTDVPGTFKVYGDLQAVAVSGDKTYRSVDGILTVPAGIYTVTYQEELVAKEYYVMYGGTGSGKSELNPAGSIPAVVATINADGWGAGDEVTVYVMDAEDAATYCPECQGRGATAHHITSWSYPAHHEATIRFTGYNGTDSHLATSGAFGGTGMMTLAGPCIFDNLTHVMTREYDASLETVGFDCTITDTVLFTKLGGEFAGTGDVWKGTFVPCTAILKPGRNNVGNHALGTGGIFDIALGGNQTLDFRTPGYRENATFTEDATFIIRKSNGVALKFGSTAQTTYNKNVNFIFGEVGTVKTSADATVYPIVKGGVQVIINKESSINGDIASYYDSTAGYWQMTVPEDDALTFTAKAGTFEVTKDLVACATAENGSRYYSSNRILTVPAGKYTITYEAPSVYYVSASGSDENDGLTAGTAFATVAKAIESTKEGHDTLLYVVGAVTLADIDHEGTVSYTSVDATSALTGSGEVTLHGPSVFNVPVKCSLVSNGYKCEFLGEADQSVGKYIIGGNGRGADENLQLNGQYFHFIRTRNPGQTEGDFNAVIDGAVVRMFGYGSDLASAESTTVCGNTNITVNSGELWYLNVTYCKPEATGALQVIFNHGTKKAFKADYSGGKPAFSEGKWIIESDEMGSELSVTDETGVFAVTGAKTAYYIANGGKTVYYTYKGKLILPAGTIKPVWTDNFSVDALPKPTDTTGYDFVGWEDDGAGTLTAIFDIPAITYVSKNGSDDNNGTEAQPFLTLAKAVDTFENESGTVIILDEAAASVQPSEFTSMVYVKGANASAKLLADREFVLAGPMSFSNLVFATDGECNILTNGYKLILGDGVTFTADKPNIINASGTAGTLAINDGEFGTVELGDDSHLIVNGSVDNVVLNGTDNNSSINVLADNGSIGSIEATDGSSCDSLQVIANNGSEVDVKAANGANWVIESEANGTSRVDFSTETGVFGVSTEAGKLPVAISDTGDVYVADTYTSKDLTPDTFYELHDYDKFINYRKPLTNTYNKIKEDKALNVLYFGGSVTAGYGSSNAEKYSWRGLIGQWLVDNFPEAKITNINRATGESGTYLGTFRVQRDVIAHKPDLLFLEYSINDKYYGSSYAQAALQYETIIREVKEALPDCDIVTILVTDSGAVGDAMRGKLHTQAQAHEDMAVKYNVPTVQVGLALAAQLPANYNYNTDWVGKIMLDTVHPLDAGYAIYYDVIKEFMYNSLFCTDYNGYVQRDDELIPVQSNNLFDGNRKITEITSDLITKSTALGGSGYSYNSGFYGVHDYYGYLSSSNPNGVFAFEFDGTEMAILTNFYSESAMSVSIDGGAYKEVACMGHNPSKVVENIASGHHVIRVKPVFKTGSPANFNIGAIFTRDKAAQTTIGTVYEDFDYANYTFTLPAGNYKVVYVDEGTKICDLASKIEVSDNVILKGYDCALDTVLTKGLVAKANVVDVNKYLMFAGAQIRVTGTQGLRFIAEKSALIDDEATIDSFGIVVAPSVLLGDTRSYNDYVAGGNNSVTDIIGADKLFIGSTHDYAGNTYASGNVVAENIFEETDDYTRYTACITGITSAKYDRLYTVKAYVTYEDCFGTSRTAYCDAFRSSVYEVSKAIDADDSASDAEKELAATVIAAVED